MTGSQVTGAQAQNIIELLTKLVEKFSQPGWFSKTMSSSGKALFGEKTTPVLNILGSYTTDTTVFPALTGKTVGSAQKWVLEKAAHGAVKAGGVDDPAGSGTRWLLSKIAGWLKSITSSGKLGDFGRAVGGYADDLGKLGKEVALNNSANSSKQAQRMGKIASRYLRGRIPFGKTVKTIGGIVAETPLIEGLSKNSFKGLGGKIISAGFKGFFKKLGEGFLKFLGASGIGPIFGSILYILIKYIPFVRNIPIVGPTLKWLARMLANSGGADLATEIDKGNIFGVLRGFFSNMVAMVTYTKYIAPLVKVLIAGTTACTGPVGWIIAFATSLLPWLWGKLVASTPLGPNGTEKNKKVKAFGGGVEGVNLEERYTRLYEAEQRLRGQFGSGGDDKLTEIADAQGGVMSSPLGQIAGTAAPMLADRIIPGSGQFIQPVLQQFG